MAIEIVDFPIKNGGSFHSFLYVYQRVIKRARAPHVKHIHLGIIPGPSGPSDAANVLM